ncbi:MAG: flagellar basal-body MS-ring/collar protein FliF [Alphaproteobacteria bacterium]|nr:flagellar basal-body MS-ring/collar protein FliF [Alphaproteobacteria bacterium]
MEGFIGFLRNLGPGRLTAIGATVVALFVFFTFLISRFSTEQMSLLFGELDPKDSAAIITKLDTMEIPYKIGTGGTHILVPHDQVDKLRLNLAREGIPHGGSVGYEIFDKSDGFGLSQFMQNMNHVRALEGELSRTISSIHAVKSARVHLVFGKKELFSRDSLNPSASIIISMRTSERLSKAEVASVQHLVASAVPGLKPSQISIVDDRGVLLAKGFSDENDPSQYASNNDELRFQFEQRMRRSLEDMLEKTLGPGNTRVEVTANLDFNRIVSNEEIYDPDGKVTRSTQNNEDSSENQEQESNSNVSAQNNTPAASGAADGGTKAKGQTKRTEETINYEISKTIKQTTKEVGEVKKISVAVLVDGNYTKNDKGEETYQPRNEEEIKQITTLIKSAIGFDEKRNDAVQVVNMRFQKPVLQPDIQEDKIMGMNKSELLRIAENIGFAFVGFLALLLVVRPVMMRAFEGASTRSGGALTVDGETMVGALQGPSQGKNNLQNTSSGKINESEEAEKMINLEQVAGKVKASSLHRLTRIIENHPEEAVSVIRAWLHQDGDR